MAGDKISILHIGSDEKFLNAANYVFEKAFPGSNLFIIPHSKKSAPLKYVEIKSNIEVVPYQKNLTEILAKRSEMYDCIILHGIGDFNSHIFLSSKNKNKFIGVLWGAELYNRQELLGRSVLGKLTAVIEPRLYRKSLIEQFKDILRKIYYLKQNINQNSVKEAAGSLSYLATLQKEEHDYFVERKIIRDDCIYVPFTYYPLEFIMKGIMNSIVNGNDILLGNSASSTNNHLEAFELLKQMVIGNRKIVVPLSYGNPVYANYIQKEGEAQFGENFSVLRKFLPLADYNKVVQKCGIVIMNHYRQQGIGNILASLWLGSKVYLNGTNTMYHYLKRIGIRIYSIEKELFPGNEAAFQNLTFEEIDHNRRILHQEIGEEHIIHRLRESITGHFS